MWYTVPAPPVTVVKPESSLRNHLKAIRTRLGLSQQELAAAAGITRQTVGGIEAGLYAPSATVALRLARALGCRMEDLFWLEEDLPVVEARPAESVPVGAPVRLRLAPVGGQWVAHPLRGESAFPAEMAPTDGLGTWEPGAETLRVELLDDPEALARTVVLAGCTPVLSLWARAAERWHPGLRVHWQFANSTAALHALARGEVHAAGVHFSEAEGDNAPHVRQLVAQQAVALVNLGVWEEGLAVGPGNPLGVRRGADLARPDVTLVNREEGAGCRLLLDEMLAEDGVPPGAVCGYDQLAGSHLDVARAVAAGRADVGVTAAAVAVAYGLDFVPLRAVRYDLALLKPYLDHAPVRQLLATLDHRWLRSQLHVLGGYDTARTGEIVAEVA